MVGASSRISGSVESANRSTPSICSDGSNDTIETFSDLTMMDDIDDDMVSKILHKTIANVLLVIRLSN